MFTPCVCIFLLTLVGVEGNDCPTETSSGPEVASNDSVERDIDDGGALISGSAGDWAKIVEKPRLDVSLPVATDTPLHKLVPDLQRQAIVFPGDNAVHDLQKVSAVDAGVSMSWQRVPVDAQLTIKNLLYNNQYYSNYHTSQASVIRGRPKAEVLLSAENRNRKLTVPGPKPHKSINN